MLKRASGILCPIFSLPNNEGIGTLGKKAFEFVEFLERAKQTYWQILPIGVTSYGDSPYQSFSSFAGNPYFIDLQTLVKEGLLTSDDIKIEWYHHKEYIEYEILWNQKMPLLRKAFQNSDFNEENIKDAFKQFFWLEDYATFMALKNHFGGASRLDWSEGSLKSLLSEELKKELAPEMAFHTFMQVKFYEQWFALKKFANNRNIQIVGDLPIFVSNDSADVWASPEYFFLDEKGQSTVVAGVPPDYFSETGQLWGNPLYDWDKIQKDDFSWWIQRIEGNLSLFDVVRIDHFRGFESYWSVPFGEETAMNGKWVKAPGKELFRLLQQKIKNLSVIAEDLGVITPEVNELIEETGFPGMCILQFAFDFQEDNPYKPENILENRVVYTGTHDNDTSIGWFCDPQNSEQVQNLVSNYFKVDYLTPEEFIPKFIEMAWACKARTAIVPVQDLLSKGTEARINTPSTLGDNWKWRMLDIPNYQTDWLIYITEKYNRV